MSMQATILLMSLATLAAAAALGVTIGLTTMRRTMAAVGMPQGVAIELDQTEQAYLLASALTSVAAFAAFRVDLMAFFILTVSAASFLAAEHVMVPRMRRSLASDGVVGRDARTTFEMAQAMVLLTAFFMLTLPPLTTLARVWGV
jgi:hypothetical protein